MKRIFKQCCLTLLAFLWLLPTAMAAQPLMAVEDVQPGMRGIAKTVVSGTKIEEFGVEVISVMKNKGSTGDLILVRTYGDLIERSGGVAQGMSGSPVYIDGKLAGAIAYGWSLTDHKICMVTPIQEMLKLWQLPDKNAEEKTTTTVEAGLEKLATPLMVTGFTPQGLRMLQDKLQPLKLVPYAAGDVPTGVSFAPLEPGSAIGLELVSGDVTIGALGTVTYVEGDKVLAFGHPFLRKGNVGYFMTNAYVFTTVASLDNSFKVGATGEVMGLIHQDRGSGVAGRAGQYPSFIPMRITVKDQNTGNMQDAAVQVVQDEQLSALLATITMFNVIDKAMDRGGPGTAQVSFEISGRNLPGETIKRENLFYSPANISEAAVGEFLDAMLLLTANKYQLVDVTDIKVNVTVEEQRQTAAIIEAQVKEKVVRPGEKVEITVKLKPFRGEAVTHVIPFTVPAEQAPGSLSLEIRGGGMVPLLQLLAKGTEGTEELLQLLKKDNNKQFADVVKDFTKRDHNNDIVVEILDAGSYVDNEENAAPELKKSKLGIKKQDSSKLDNEDIIPKNLSLKKNGRDKMLLEGRSDKVKNSIATNYVVTGDTQIILTVEPKPAKQ